MNNNKHKRISRSRSRSKSRERGHKNSARRPNDRERYRHRERKRESPRNKKKYSSPSSESNSSSSSSSASNPKNEANSNIQANYYQNEDLQESRYRIEQTKTLKVENCTQKQQLQRVLIDFSINAGTSVPDQIQVRDGSTYAKYPSVQVSTIIKQLINEAISINGKSYRVNYYPLKRIDLNASYDWYCDKCEYKNFARRNKCYRCDNEKNQNCKLNYTSTPPTIVKVNKQQNINNCSLMIRGPIIMQTEEEDLLDIFESITSVKDIRMIKNKMTGQLKDFAFVQFFTPEDAALVLKQTSHPDFKIRGQKISIMYSRNKCDDDYAKPLPYEKKERKKEFGKKDKKSEEVVESYYNRQRQIEIQQQKQRPIITMDQLKQKMQQELKKKAANVRQLTQEQSKRRQAELMAKQWEKQVKMQNTVLYVCILCHRKFKGEQDMKLHEVNSELHRFNKQKFQLSI